MSSVTPPVVSNSHPMSSPSLGAIRYGRSLSSGGTELAFLRSASVIIPSTASALRKGDERWPRKARRGSFVVRCGADETPNSGVPATPERRSSKTAYSGAERIARAQEATKRRAHAKGARKLSSSSRPLLLSLHERIRQNQWVPALKLFELVRAQAWYVAESSTYLKLFTMLANAKQPAEAARLFDALLDDNLTPTTAIFTALLTVYSKTNHFTKAVQTFESMRLFAGCLPDKYTYTAMIKGCCEAGLHDHARKIFDEMLLEGVKPSIVTYNTLIFGYGKAGLFREIERMLTLMQANRTPPDTVTWNTLIRVFALHNRIADMEQACEGLLEQGLKPDVVTLNILLAAYGTAGLFAKMESVKGYMARYSYPTTTVTHNTIIEMYGKAGKVEEMETAFKAMKRDAVRPNGVTFCALLTTYGQHGRWHLVEKVLQEAQEGDAVSTAVWNAAIDAYQRAQNFEDMENVVEEMKRKGFAFDDVTYSILISAYTRVMRLEKAAQLQDEWDAAKKLQSDYCESS